MGADSHEPSSLSCSELSAAQGPRRFHEKIRHATPIPSLILTHVPFATGTLPTGPGGFPSVLRRLLTRAGSPQEVVS